MTTKRRAGFAASFLALTIVAGACGGDDAADDATTTSAAAAEGTDSAGGSGAAEKLSGKINISGSSTVEPISQRVKELFNDEQGDGEITVEGPGTGDGFKKFCAGETDISDASRKIKDEEAKACADAGIEYVELKVAIDGMSVLTSSPNNTAVACLSFPDLYALIGPESTGFAKWSDAAAIAKELGSNTVFPAADLAITGPGEESGTFDSFVELAIDPIAGDRAAGSWRGQGGAPAPRTTTASANDNVIIEEHRGLRHLARLGGLRLRRGARRQGRRDRHRQGGDGTCVAPTAETIADGSYPLARPLFIYVNTKKAAESPALVGYVDYYLEAGYEAVSEVGYVALPDSELAETVAAWKAVTG